MRLPGGSHIVLGAYVSGLCCALACRPSVGWLVAGIVPALVWMAAWPRLTSGALGGGAQGRAWLGELRRPLAIIPLVALCGLTVGILRLDDVGRSELVGLAGESGIVVGEVLALPDVSGDTAGVDLLVTQCRGEACREKVRLQIDLSEAEESRGESSSASGMRAEGAQRSGVAPQGRSPDAPAGAPSAVTLDDLTDPVRGLVEGVTVRIDDTDIELPPEPREGEFDYGRYLERRGQHVVLAAPLEACAVIGRRGGLPGVVDRLRLAARGHLRRGLRPPVREVLEAMVLGDDNGVDDRAVDDFRRSGLLHIMAVSGENVVLLCAIAGLALRLIGLPRGVRTATLIPVVCVYVIVTGASPSIVRAGVAGVAGLLATLVSRPTDGWLLLLAPGAYLLTFNPNALYDVSFQLSFAAVVGLLTLSRPLTSLAARALPAALAEQAGVTTAASIATAPVSILTFGSASVVSVAANLAAGFVLGPIMLLGMISVLIGFVSTWLSLPLNYLAGVFIGFMLSVAAFFGRLPFAVWEWHGVTLRVALAVAVGGEAAAIAALARRRGISFGAVLCDRRNRARLVVVTCLVVALALVAAPAPPAPPRAPALTFLDVGEGAATLLQVPDGPTVLFDAGPRPLADTLRLNGAKRIDLLVLSHGHADHTAGLSDVLGAVPVGRALVPCGSAESESLAGVVRRLADAGVPTTVVTDPLALGAGPARVDVLPTAAGEGGGNQGENDRALVCIVTLAGERVLLPGDAEGEVLEPLDLGRCAVVSLPHHGSSGGFSDAQIDEFQPRLAVIPVGENRFGHPTAEMIDLLMQNGVPFLRTDQEGDVTLSASDSGLRVSTRRR